MKRTLLFLTFCLLIGPSLKAENYGLEYYGYLENTLTAEENKAKDKTAVTNETRVRLNLTKQYEELGDFSIAIIGTRYGGSKTINLCDYLPEEEAERFDFPIAMERTGDIWLQEAYGSLYHSDYMLRIGRQKYYTGTGYAWNPTDLFNWKNVFDPTYEIEGLDSVLLARTLPGDGRISVYYSFGTSQVKEDRSYEASEDGDYQVKLKTHLASWELSMQYSEVWRDFADYEGLLSGAVTEEEMVSRIKWKLVAAEISGEIAGIGIHFEGGYADLSDENGRDDLPEKLTDHKRYLFGADYTFENGLFVIFEYYHEGLGETDDRDYTLNQRMAYLSGEMDSVGQDNYYLGLSYPVTDLTTFALYTIINGNDSSLIVNPWLTWIAANDITINLSAQIPSGDETSAAGRSGAVVFGRVNFSF